MSPLVSVGVPTFNGSRYVERTIRSVLAQELTDFELIICDDGSTDRTLELVAGFADPRIRIEPGPADGAAANFNRLIDLSRGRWFKLLCQDDLLYPDCLRRQVDALERGADDHVVMATSRRDIIDDDDRVILRAHGWRSAAGVVNGDVVIRSILREGKNLVGEPSAVLSDRATLVAMGGFSTDQAYTVDVDAWIRLMSRGNLAYIPEALCTFRISSSSWSSRLARQQGQQVRATMRAIARDHGDIVSRFDLASGLVRGGMLAAARRGVFAAARRLPARGTVQIGAPVPAPDDH